MAPSLALNSVLKLFCQLKQGTNNNCENLNVASLKSFYSRHLDSEANADLYSSSETIPHEYFIARPRHSRARENRTRAEGERTPVDPEDSLARMHSVNAVSWYNSSRAKYSRATVSFRAGNQPLVSSGATFRVERRRSLGSEEQPPGIPRGGVL